MGLKEHYIWRHNDVLRVFKKYLDEKIADIDKVKLPTAEVTKKIDFHKEEQQGDATASNTLTVEEKFCGGSWMVSADLKSRLVFPIVRTTTLKRKKGTRNFQNFKRFEKQTS